MLIEGGAGTVSAVEARVFELLERAGVFLAGGVLVGSHAFALYGNMLGVRWASEVTRTQDVDIAAEQHLVIGVPDVEIDLRKAIIDSELGFIEIPALNRRSPSTKFRIRGRQLSVDILTPMLGRASSKPISTLNLSTSTRSRSDFWTICSTMPNLLSSSRKAGCWSMSRHPRGMPCTSSSSPSVALPRFRPSPGRTSARRSSCSRFCYAIGPAIYVRRGRLLRNGHASSWNNCARASRGCRPRPGVR